MSFLSMVKGLVHHSHGSASAGLLLPLPAGKVESPTRISLHRWLELPIDERAPVRSVALVDLLHDGFVAIVVDTVEERLRWHIVGAREHLLGLHEGMLGSARMRARGTSVVSYPLGERRAAPSPDGGGGGEASELMAEVITDPCADAWDSDDGGGGTKGVVARQVLGAAKAQAGLHVAERVHLTDAAGRDHGFLLVEVSDLQLGAAR